MFLKLFTSAEKDASVNFAARVDTFRHQKSRLQPLYRTNLSFKFQLEIQP